jgi:hypothetical protein
MVRVIITQLLLFLLPFLAYAAYLFLTKKLHRKVWIDAPRYWLVIAGFVCSLIGFGVLAMINNNPTGGTYIPAHYKDGVLIPGQIVKDVEADANPGQEASSGGQSDSNTSDKN